MRSGRNCLVQLVSLMVMLGLCGCDMLAYRKFQSPQNHFTILLPRWWREFKDPKAVVMVKAPPDRRDDKFLENINVRVNQLPTKISLETFVDYNREELLRVMPKATDMKVDASYIGLTPGRILSFTNEVEGVTLRILSGVWMKEGRVYVVTCAGEAQRLRKYLPIFKYVIHSLRMQ